MILVRLVCSAVPCPRSRPRRRFRPGTSMPTGGGPPGTWSPRSAARGRTSRTRMCPSSPTRTVPSRRRPMSRPRTRPGVRSWLPPYAYGYRGGGSALLLLLLPLLLPLPPPPPFPPPPPPPPPLLLLLPPLLFRTPLTLSGPLALLFRQSMLCLRLWTLLLRPLTLRVRLCPQPLIFRPKKRSLLRPAMPSRPLAPRLG